MARYTTSHQTPAGTNLSILVIESSATVRAKIDDIILGSDATPADVATEFALLRHTTAGTGGTATVEKPTDPISAAASCNARGGTMTEPTYEAVASDGLMQLALNQRATFRWVALREGAEFMTVIGTANGIGLRSIASGGTPNMNCTIGWTE